ncbi:PilZ domain-containing protein [Geosporobacter subterraneus DSM 17957]|uniref:PilZ domain-containing protein n=1 Tax=Geosporobacter subterraneus DSM 17957 TaxID=1121919 RepID=A0A1M6CNQ4_9FIRM|nr:PilZ domain-containing protein [Geosporobacter subterraneus]SHI62675.1 PilZ domain-containing protein [Geosporobacter subterraneus DSM 17957]
MRTTVLENKREYFRLDLKPPLCASMRIVLIDGQPKKTGSTSVCIEDIGAGGLRFISHLKFPESRRIILEFDSRICGQYYKFWGSVVRAEKKEEGIWEYAIAFYVDEPTRSKYITLFNQLAVKLYKFKQWGSCDICPKEEPMECLRSRC